MKKPSHQTPGFADWLRDHALKVPKGIEHRSPPKKQTEAKDYGKMYREISPFVSFELKKPDHVGARTKSKITKYHKYISRLMDKKGIEGKPAFRVVVPPKGRSFEKIQKDIAPTFARIPKRIKKTDFKVLFVPETGKVETLKYSKRMKKWTLKEGKGKRARSKFVLPIEDRDDFALDARGTIKKMLKKYRRAKEYSFQNQWGWEDGGRFPTPDRLISEMEHIEKKSGGELEGFVHALSVWV